MKKTIKVKVQNGVYVHRSGNLLTVQIGEVENAITGEIALGITTTGTNTRDEETTRVFPLRDEETACHFAMVLNECEYLGEL